MPGEDALTSAMVIRRDECLLLQCLPLHLAVLARSEVANCQVASIHLLGC